MPTPEEILKEALEAPAKTELASYMQSIQTLREKKWSWRDIAEFLKERGVDTDHTKLIRFYQKATNRWVVPTAGDYLAALRTLRSEGKLTGPRWAMLNFHFQAHNRTVTYTELAEAAARAGAHVSSKQPHTYANLEYGTLGKLLGQYIGMEFLQDSKRGAPFYSSAIGVGSMATPEDTEFELVMHHELAKALDQLFIEEAMS